MPREFAYNAPKVLPTRRFIGTLHSGNNALIAMAHLHMYVEQFAKGNKTTGPNYVNLRCCCSFAERILLQLQSTL